MQRFFCKKILCLVFLLLLTAASCTLAGCTTGNTPEKPLETVTAPTLIDETPMILPLPPEIASEMSEAFNGFVEFTLEVTGSDGVTQSQIVSSDCKTVGEALLRYGIIEGEDGPYGLYVKTVLGETHDYDTDGFYWAFYIDGEYALSGVEQTEIVSGQVYALRAMQ